MRNKLKSLFNKLEILKVILLLGIVFLGITTINNNQKNKYSAKKEKYYLLKQELLEIRNKENYVELKNSEHYISAKNKKKKIEGLFTAFKITGNESHNFASRSNILNLLNEKINYLDSKIEEIKQ